MALFYYQALERNGRKTKGMKNIQTERIIPKIILVRILSIHPYAVLVGSN